MNSTAHYSESKCYCFQVFHGMKCCHFMWHLLFSFCHQNIYFTALRTCMYLTQIFLMCDIGPHVFDVSFHCFYTLSYIQYGCHLQRDSSWSRVFQNLVTVNAISTINLLSFDVYSVQIFISIQFETNFIDSSAIPFPIASFHLVYHLITLSDGS